MRRAPPLKRHLAFINKLSKGDALFLRATRTGCRPNDRLGGTAAGRADLESLDPVNNRVASGTLGAGLNPLRTTNDLILSKLGRGSLPGRSIYSSFNRSFLLWGRADEATLTNRKQPSQQVKKVMGNFQARKRMFFNGFRAAQGVACWRSCLKD